MNNQYYNKYNNIYTEFIVNVPELPVISIPLQLIISTLSIFTPFLSPSIFIPGIVFELHSKTLFLIEISPEPIIYYLILVDKYIPSLKYA